MEITILVALFLIFTTIIYLSSLTTIILLLLILFQYFRQLDSFQRPTVSNTDKKNEWGIPPEWGWGENNAEVPNHVVHNETAHVTHEDGWYSDDQPVPNHLHYLFGKTTSPGKIRDLLTDHKTSSYDVLIIHYCLLRRLFSVPQNLLDSAEEHMTESEAAL